MKKFFNALSTQRLRSLTALLLCFSIIAQPLQAVPLESAKPLFSIQVPARLGFITDTYSPKNIPTASPDVVLIQNLHVNRSVQFAISGILKALKAQNLLPNRIAVEGESGPVDLAGMQKYPDARVRKAAADYLVQQGEMPGPMHYVVSEGRGGLYGVETEAVYKANLEVYRESYEQRMRLTWELDKLTAALPTLEKDPTLGEKAKQLAQDIAAVNRLINAQTIPDEMASTLNRVLSSVERVKQVLPADVAGSIEKTLSSGTNFYALALMRDEDFFKNTLALRETDHQTTAVLITGGFHTQGLAEACKAKGLSYVVITPVVKSHGAVDQRLYIERLLGRHLTPQQIAQGLDWASMDMLEPLYRAGSLFVSAISSVFRPRRNLIATAVMTMGLTILAPFASPQGRQPTPAAQRAPARPFHTLQDWTQFILDQRVPNPNGGGMGLPLTFRPGPGTRMPDQRADVIVHRAAALYDTSIAIRGLTDAGRFREARSAIQFYADAVQGATYGDMELRAFPSSNNGGAFLPFSEARNYFFNLTPADGQWQSGTYQWEFWATHTGPNAWLLNAVVHYIQQSGDRSFIPLARHIGDSMLLLQDAATQGGVRYGPHGNYSDAAPNDPDYDFKRINSENNVSAYAAWNHLAALTGDAKYSTAAGKILSWFADADIYNPKTGRMQKGMMDPSTGLLYVDAQYNTQSRRWELVPEHAEDSGGSWTISALGPETIDHIWGKGAAYRMWTGIRSTFGWKADFSGRPGPNDALATVDFKGGYAPGEGLGTAEWAGGAEKADEEGLIPHYVSGPGQGVLNPGQIDGLRRDAASLDVWLDAHPNAYAEGPGMRAPRNGRTGWGWFSGRGDAIVAGYRHLKGDPLKPQVKVNFVRRAGGNAPVVVTPETRPSVPATRPPAEAPRTAPAPAPTPAPTEVQAPAAAFSLMLTEQYGGADYFGSWKAVSPSQSQQIRSADYLEYSITPPAGSNFKGFHIDIKGGANLTLYGLFANKQGTRWVLEPDAGQQATKAALTQDGTKIVVRIPVSEIEAAIRKARAPRIENVQIQTGMQQEGHPLNDSIIRTQTVVRPILKQQGANGVPQGLQWAGSIINNPNAVLFKGMVSMGLALAVLLGSPGSAHSAPLRDTVAQTATTAFSVQSFSSGPSIAPLIVIAGIASVVGAIFLVHRASRQAAAVLKADGATLVEATVARIPASRSINIWRSRLGVVPAIALVSALLMAYSCSQPTQSDRTETPIADVQNLGQSTIAPTTLYDHYEGVDYPGYFTKVSPAVSSRILNSQYIRYTFRPSDFDAFKGFHIQIDDRNEQPFYGLYGHKVDGAWKFADESDAPISSVKANEVEGAIYVVIPVSQVKAALQKTSADGIGILHGQTGQQQNRQPLNERNIRTGIAIEAFGADLSGALPGDLSIIPVHTQAPDPNRLYDQVLYDHYEGDSWQGYFTRVQPAQSRRILAAEAVEYVVRPRDYDNFKGVHVDIKGPDEAPIYSLFAIKRAGQWRFENAEDDNENKTTKASIREEDGAIVIQIPMAELKAAMAKEKATGIGQFHGQTGQQQDGKSLNDRNMTAGIQVRTIGGQTAVGRVLERGTQIVRNANTIVIAVTTALAAVLGLSYMAHYASAQAGTIAPQIPSTALLSAGISVNSVYQAVLLAAFIAAIYLFERSNRSKQNKAVEDELREVLPHVSTTDSLNKHVRDVLDYAPEWLRELFLKNPALASRYGARVNQMGVLAMMAAA